MGTWIRGHTAAAAADGSHERGIGRDRRVDHEQRALAKAARHVDAIGVGVDGDLAERLTSQSQRAKELRRHGPVFESFELQRPPRTALQAAGPRFVPVDRTTRKHSSYRVQKRHGLYLLLGKRSYGPGRVGPLWSSTSKSRTAPKTRQVFGNISWKSSSDGRSWQAARIPAEMQVKPASRYPPLPPRWCSGQRSRVLILLRS